MRLIAFLLTLLSLTGCVSVPPDDEQPIANGVEVARSVVLCQTKVASLQAQLGTPSREGILGGARIVTWVVEWDPLVKYLGVMANQDGTVVDLYWDLPSEIQWSPVDRCK
jgi:hypothetical protein